MQVHAIDENRPISAIKADKGKNYQCPECQALVRLRRGMERQPHFFHLQAGTKCRLSQKGMIHLQLQHFIKSLFEFAEMEKPFPEIGRIADVADSRRKIVFEIQYSPMALEEAKGRCSDYESLGYQVIWILHEDTFNQNKISSTERFLRTKTSYFSSMNEEGKGIIYDQLDVAEGKRRVSRSESLQVDLKTLQPLPKFKWPAELFYRSQTWPLYSEGDLLDLSVKGKFTSATKLRTLRFRTRLREAYLSWLQVFLAKSSR